MSARRPTAKFPNRCRAWCSASPTTAGCREFATRIGLPLQRSRGLPPHNLGDAAAVAARPGVAGSHPPAPGPLASRFGWRRQANRERHAPPVADQMTLAPALGPISGIWTGLVTAVDRSNGTTVHDRPRPIDLVG